MAVEDDPFAGTRMTLGQHLGELRRRVLIGLAAVAVAFAATWGFSDVAVRVVLAPYDRMVGMLEDHYREIALERVAEEPERRDELFEPGSERLVAFRDARLQATGPGEGFFFVLQICLYFAIFLGSPVLIWQLWLFVAAGLYPPERRAILRFLPASIVLFVAGVLFGYFLLVPYGMYFLNLTAPLELVRPDFRAREYFGFLSALCIALGFVFQMPVVMIVLSRIGVVSPKAFARYRRHVIVGMILVAAVLTPPDPFTQMMMAVPMVLLYELGILGARAGGRRARAPERGGGGEGAEAEGRPS